jgi:hypothetical protein
MKSIGTGHGLVEDSQDPAISKVCILIDRFLEKFIGLDTVESGEGSIGWSGKELPFGEDGPGLGEIELIFG